MSREFGIEQIKSLIKGEIGRDIIFSAAVDSTNTLAMVLGDKGAPHGTVVVADMQYKGRGRLGRTWVSPPGVNIYMSVLLRPAIKSEDATLLTIMAAVACARAIRTATGLQVKIKWPNDLMVSDKKVGGILTEIKSCERRIIFAVIGVGINVNASMEDFPPDVRSAATSIRNETAKEQSRDLLIADILNELDRWYAILIMAGRKTLLDEWRCHTSTLKRSVTVTLGKEVYSGIAEDIDDEGMLMLKLPSGVLKKISAGDLTILR
ncbi:MAG: biotin--[acetyl-CoA-carboxylase] ligase [Thermodesulfovibrionales bacterium]